MGIRKATVVSILKKDGVVSARCRSRQRLTGKKRGLVFADDQQINVVREFDEELPVVAVAKPYNYEEGSYKQYDHIICEGDDDDEVYWWEEEEEILPWYEMEDETELRSYQWDDVTDKAHAKYRTSAMDGLVDVEMAWEEYEVADDDKYADGEHGGDGDGDDDSSTSSGSSSGSSSSSSSSSSASSYEDVTVSDDDDAYQLKGNTVQLDIAHLAAVKSEAEGDPNKASVVAANPIKSPVVSSQTTPKAVAGKVSVPIVRGGKQSPTPAPAAPKSPATPTDGSKPSPARVRPKRTSRSNSFKSVKRDEDLDTSDKSQPSPGSTKATSTLPASPPLVSAPAPAPAKASRNPVRRVATIPARRPSADKSKAIASDRRSSLDDSATDNMTDYSTKSENGTRATAPEKQGGKASPRSSIKAIRDLKEMKLAKKKKERTTSAPAPASTIPTIATSIANDPAVKVVKKKKHHHKTKRHHSTESGKSNKSSCAKKEKGRRSSLTKNNNKEKEEVYKQSDAEYLNKYTWEKPDWTNENKLKQTKKGRAVRKGANLARPITMINRAMNDMADAKRMRNMSSFGKPEWTKKSSILKKTDTGEQLGTGANLARKITHITSDASCDGKLGWEKPEWAKEKPVKPTPQGQKVQKGQNLAKGITNDVEVKEKFPWEKPSWAKEGLKLKSTEKGQKLKDGDSLAKPITFPKGKK